MTTNRIDHQPIVFQATASDGRFYPSCTCGLVFPSGADLAEALDEFDAHLPTIATSSPKEK